MMTFAQEWERQERLRHRSLLQQLKAEFSVQSPSSVQTEAMPTLPVSSNKPPHPKPRKNAQGRRSHIRSVDIR